MLSDSPTTPYNRQLDSLRPLLGSSLGQAKEPRLEQAVSLDPMPTRRRLCLIRGTVPSLAAQLVRHFAGLELPQRPLTQVTLVRLRVWPLEALQRGSFEPGQFRIKNRVQSRQKATERALVQESLLSPRSVKVSEALP